MENIILPKKQNLDLFDKHEGSLRTEKKIFVRTEYYKGFEIMKNANVPVGAEGYWEIPKLKWFGKGGMQIGYLTVSIIQAKAAIDRYIEFNI